MEASLRRSGYRMRPSLVADRKDIAAHIFGDVQVAKTLVHNAATREAALVAADIWIDSLAADGTQATNKPGHIGLWTIRDHTRNDSFVGIRGVFVAPGLPENAVATFVAVARTYWGRGVSGDSSALLCRNVFETSETDAIYTRVWPKLNPASDAVQRKLGFEPAERHSLRNTFGEQRMLEVLEYDLWRLSNVDGADSEDTLRQVSIRIGQLAAENLIQRGLAAKRIRSALPSHLADRSGIRDEIRIHLETGYRNPAWASYRMSRDAWKASSTI